MSESIQDSESYLQRFTGKGGSKSSGSPLNDIRPYCAKCMSADISVTISRVQVQEWVEGLRITTTLLRSDIITDAACNKCCNRSIIGLNIVTWDNNVQDTR